MTCQERIELLAEISEAIQEGLVRNNKSAPWVSLPEAGEHAAKLAMTAMNEAKERPCIVCGQPSEAGAMCMIPKPIFAAIAIPFCQEHLSHDEDVILFWALKQAREEGSSYVFQVLDAD